MPNLPGNMELAFHKRQTFSNLNVVTMLKFPSLRLEYGILEITFFVCLENYLFFNANSLFESFLLAKIRGGLMIDI